jgi:TRAP-type uncharacterized transport system substrate-binding protein
VDASLGLKYVHELNGVTIHPGGTGSANTLLAMDACKIIGVKPNWFVASSGDGIDAVCNRQIPGSIRNGSPGDAQIMQMLAAINIRFLTFTNEEVSKIQEVYPYVMKSIIPAGSYRGQDYDYTTIASAQGGIASTQMTQAQVYAMISALMSEQGKAKWTAAYTKGADFDVIGMTLKIARVPLHAGVVQYMVENGYTVPAELIPPEYVPVR